MQQVIAQLTQSGATVSMNSGGAAELAYSWGQLYLERHRNGSISWTTYEFEQEDSDHQYQNGLAHDEADPLEQLAQTGYGIAEFAR